VPVLIPRRGVELSPLKDRAFVSVPVALDPRTASLEVRLRRPTTPSPLAWDATGRVEVSLVLVADGVEHRCVGSAGGGIRFGIDGREIAEYVLRYTPTWGFFGARGGRTTRLGEGKASYQARLEIRLLRGTVATEVAVTNEILAAPDVPFRNSVAFDAATDAQEVSGDGVLSLSHTSAGADRAVFAGVGAGSNPGRTTTSVTYAGTTMTEMWDLLTNGPFVTNSGHRLAGQATGAQTVTSTLSGTAGEHALGVISMTGVDATTPVGTPVTTSVNDLQSSISVTVGTVGADDLLVDNIVGTYATMTVGADQTLRNTETVNAAVDLRESTQPGTAGGVMSYAISGERFGLGASLGAVAFKPAAGGAAAAVFRKTISALGTRTGSRQAHASD